MSDPLRTDEPRPLESAPHVGREEKIEQLLLTGLEHYFAAEYDQAINIWTRALFIDRGHARARAYIERARCAQAERQRECEELLQRGVTAFQQGAADEARRLLRDAIDQGAPPEEALAILERINRLDVVAPQIPAAGPGGSSAAPTAPASRAVLVTFVLLAAVIVAAVAFAAGVFREDGTLLARPTPAAGVIPVPAADGPPLPRRGENALNRGRALAQAGRLREAIAVLETVRVTDVQKADADRLRADLQKQLVAMTAGAATSPTRNAPEP